MTAYKVHQFNYTLCPILFRVTRVLDQQNVVVKGKGTICFAALLPHAADVAVAIHEYRYKYRTCRTLPVVPLLYL